MFKLIQLLTLGAFQFCIVRQGEVRVIEQRGKFRRVAEPGVQLLWSLWGWGDTIGRFTISQIARNEEGRIVLVPTVGTEVISTRMQVDDYPKESVITRDNATVFIDAVVYYRVTDAAKAVYEVQDYVSALQKLVQSALRDECGKYELDELLVSRDQINTQLRIVLDEATDPWGIKVDRVEIKDIDLGTFGQILAEQRAAETRRRTEITEAEGNKRAAILQAEGEYEASLLAAKGDKLAIVLKAEADKEAAVLQAEAQAEAEIKVREAQARGYMMLQKALSAGHPDHNAQLLELVHIQSAAEAAQAMASDPAAKMWLPADLTSMLGVVRSKLEPS